jgi:hypothetical protein
MDPADQIRPQNMLIPAYAHMPIGTAHPAGTSVTTGEVPAAGEH